MWDKVDIDTGAAREKELCKHYWAPMISRGAGFSRFRGNPEDVWEIIDDAQRTPRPLLLQTEMVEKNIPLSRTSAVRNVSVEGKHSIMKLLSRLAKSLCNPGRTKEIPTKG
ncbi:MAG TPA: hypothetical protein VGO47_09870 [Chlamydiales bacterium]|nr:hypothetical protein [Chlamydiales bacterium]